MMDTGLSNGALIQGVFYGMFKKGFVVDHLDYSPFCRQVDGIDFHGDLRLFHFVFQVFARSMRTLRPRYELEMAHR